MRSTGVWAGAMDVIPETPLSQEEIGELDLFLMSDATPDECMDIVTLDGFLTALAIGPDLVPPSVWLPVVWGREKEPVFESAAQAERIIAILLRRFNDIGRMFGENATGFEPLLYTRERWMEKRSGSAKTGASVLWRPSTSLSLIGSLCLTTSRTAHCWRQSLSRAQK
jgi:hypothetical protein